VSRLVLSLNAGSSTLKYGLYRFEESGERELMSDTLETHGSASAEIVAKALEGVEKAAGSELEIVGHRVVHGGDEFVAPTRVDRRVLERLRALSSLAPLHLPPALDILQAATERLPNALHVACFDTAFHRTLPEVARRFALPDALYRSGVRRYGFHGLSYEYVLSTFETLPARLIVAHLGSGASVTAVAQGQSVDTTMGFTPDGGIPMGTRPGDLDPGVLLYLERERGFGLEQREQLVRVLGARALRVIGVAAHAFGGRFTPPTLRSTSAAKENKRSSAKAGPSSCRPTGSAGRSAVAGVGRHGTLSPAMPAKLAGRVKTSARYMARGLSTFSPRRKAGVGLVGTAIASTDSKAWSKSRLISVRTRCAFL